MPHETELHSQGTEGKTEELLGQILEMIRAEPGIRPSEINRRLNRVETDGLRATLIRRGLVRKEKVGQASHLYPV